MDRREMLKRAALLAGSVCLCNSAAADDPPSKSTCCLTPEIEADCLTLKNDSLIIDLEKTATLKKNGQAVYVDYPEKDVKMIVVRTKRNRYYVLSRQCSHGNQALSYLPERKLLQCNSYNHSAFNLDGSVWKGPAPVAIRSFDFILDCNKLEIFI